MDWIRSGSCHWERWAARYRLTSSQLLGVVTLGIIIFLFQLARWLVQ